MRTKIIDILWGVILIALGGLLLASNQGFLKIGAISVETWAVAFAGMSLAFWLSYFISGVRRWGWLFPALIFAALAFIINSNNLHIEDSTIAAVILLSVGLPFYAGYAANNKHWGLLIPAWVLTVTALIPVLSEHLGSNIIGTLILYGIAGPFLVAFLRQHTRKWALITATVLAIIGTFPLVEFLPNEDLSGTVVMLLFVLPFLVAYFLSPKNWWALIPAGVFASIGVVALLAGLSPAKPYFLVGEVKIGSYAGVLFLGFALTFGLLWLLRHSQPTAWAIYPAIGLLAISLLTTLFSHNFDDYLLPLLFVLAGSVLIITAVLKQHRNKPVEL